MKKVILSILTSFLVLTSFGIQSVYAENDLNLNEPARISPEVIKELEKLSTQGDLGFINGIQSVVNVVGDIGKVFTAYNGIYNFLKSIGVVESPEQKAHKEIINKIDNMQSSINQMNEKLDDIITKLDNNFAEIDLDFDDVKVKLDKQNISNFTTNYDNKMVSRLSNFENTLQTKVYMWFTNTKEELVLPISYKKMENQKIDESNIETIISESNKDKNKFQNVTLNAGLLNDVFTDAIWNNKTYEDDINLIMSNYLDKSFVELTKDINLKKWELKYLAECNLIDCTETDFVDDDAINNKWINVYSSEDFSLFKEDLKNDFAKNFNQALLNKFYTEICMEKAGTTDQYVNAVCNEFRDYCNALTNPISSPYINQLDILPKIYLFQRETKEIVADLRTYYICNLTKYAIFYLGVMGTCNVVDYNGYVNLYNDSINKIVNYFDSFMVKDNQGNVIDNYCYVVNAPIEFKEGYFTQAINVYHEQYENKMFGIDYEVYNGYSQTPWKFSESNSNIVSNQDVLKIAALYKYLGYDELSKTTKSFVNYLETNMYGEIKINEKYIQKIVTNFQGSKEFNLSEHIYLDVHGIGRSTYFKNVFNMYVNNNEYSDIDDAGFLIHDSAVADRFDANTLQITANEKVLSRAFFGKHSAGWFKDEMAICANRLSSGSYNDALTKTSDDHRYYTFTYGGTYYGGYYVIKKSNTLSEKPSEESTPYHDLGQFIDLDINNTNGYFNEEDKAISSVIYFDEDKYYTENEQENENIKNEFVSYISKAEVISSMKQANKERMKEINSVKGYNEGIYEINLEKDKIDEIINKIDLTKNKNQEEITGGSIADVLDLPTLADQCKFVISSTYFPIFEIYKDDNGCNYKLRDGFIIRPYLVWNNDEKYIEVDDEIIKELNMTFKLKVLALNSKSNKIYHYKNKYDLNANYETITSTNKDNYLEFETKSFSPFILDSYYVQSKPDKTRYRVPNTGINN